jgi:hypothetical protein
MNLFRALMELDEAYNDRQALIDEIKKSGKNYNFDKYTDAQLYRMVQRIRQPRVAVKEPSHELDLDFEITRPERCDCGARLTDFGQCPVCDLGEEDLAEWIVAPSKANNISSPSATNQPVNQTTSASNNANQKYRVRIVSHQGRLRALGTDGTNPAAWVAFPNDLRQFEGQLYEVDQLIWNGKNYRVAGNIVEI